MLRRPSSKQRRLVILLLSILTFGIAYYAGNRYVDENEPSISGILIRPALPVPEFELSDQDGNPVSNPDLKGHWNLLVFDPSAGINSPAYSHLIQVHNRLAREPKLQSQIFFIHIPLRGESTEEVNKHTIRHGNNILTLQGDSSTLRETSQRFGIDETQEGFTFYLINPDLQIRALFTHSLDAATIATDLITLIANQR